MRRFFTEPQNIEGNRIAIVEDSRHISQVLRMNCGDKILVFDGSGCEYTARLTEIQKSVCYAEIIERNISLSEPKTQITLFQGLPKSGKMETIIQKAVELGVLKIVPVEMERCVTKIKNSAAGEEKALRWNKVSLEASKQCGRGIVPSVTVPISFAKAVEEMTKMQLSIMPYEELGHSGKLGLKELLQSSRDAENIALLVGPEGGFSEQEASIAIENGIKPVGLGKRILRTETVASAVIPVIMFDRDEF